MDDDPVNHSINSHIDKHHQFRTYNKDQVYYIQL
jgi:hypothetical protein